MEKDIKVWKLRKVFAGATVTWPAFNFNFERFRRLGVFQSKWKTKKWNLTFFMIEIREILVLHFQFIMFVVILGMCLRQVCFHRFCWEMFPCHLRELVWRYVVNFIINRIDRKLLLYGLWAKVEFPRLRVECTCAVNTRIIIIYYKQTARVIILKLTQNRTNYTKWFWKVCTVFVIHNCSKFMRLFIMISRGFHYYSKL